MNTQEILLEELNSVNSGVMDFWISIAKKQIGKQISEHKFSSLSEASASTAAYLESGQSKMCKETADGIAQTIREKILPKI